MAGVTAAVLAARLWWPFDLLTNFRLQILVVILGLLALAVIAGARPAAALLAVLALLHAWAVKDVWLAAPAAPVPVQDSQPLSLLTANVLRTNDRPEAVSALLRDRHPDIAVLVEAQGARWVKPLADLADLYPHAAPQDWRAASSPVVILSRLPIHYEEQAPRMADRPPYLLTTISLGGGPVTVVGVHPTSPDAASGAGSRARNRQLDLLASHLASLDGPAIVAGDFNTSLWSPHARDLLREGDLQSAARGQGWLPTWPARRPLMQVPIDHILLRGAATVTSFRRGPNIGSDHLPLFAEFRLAVPRE